MYAILFGDDEWHSVAFWKLSDALAEMLRIDSSPQPLVQILMDRRRVVSFVQTSEGKPAINRTYFDSRGWREDRD